MQEATAAAVVDRLVHQLETPADIAVQIGQVDPLAAAQSGAAVEDTVAGNAAGT